jgi:hypothetical protein
MTKFGLTSAEKKARKTLEKSFEASLRIAAKNAGWSYLKPTPFARYGEWFVSISPLIWTDEIKAQAQANIKPFGIDDLMSRILCFGSLAEKPLSLRARGPYCLVRSMLTSDIERGGNVDLMIGATLEFMKETASILENLTMDQFIEFCRDDRPIGMISDNLVAALILANRTPEARVLCDEAIANNQMGSNGRSIEDGRIVGFFELATRWMNQN